MSRDVRNRRQGRLREGTAQRTEGRSYCPGEEGERARFVDERVARRGIGCMSTSIAIRQVYLAKLSVLVLRVFKAVRIPSDIAAGCG